jgi:putative inorganic carbon (hco3(-)) transporter
VKGLIFTYVLTYGGSLLALFNPFVGLLVYVCFALVRPQSLWHWSVPAGNYSRTIALALLAGWALHGFGNWKFGRARAVVFSLIAFMAWMVLSSFFAFDTDMAWRNTESIAKIVLPFVVGITLIDSFDRVKTLAWVIMLSQGYVAYDLNMSYFGGYNRMTDAGFGGMDNNCNAIAMVCGVGFAFFLGLAETGWRRWLAFLCAALMTHAILFAFSRGGMLGLIITGGTAFMLIPKRPVYYGYLLLAILLALRMAGPEVRTRFFTTFADSEVRDTSAQSRIDMWGICWDLTLQNPIVGVGPNNFPILAKSLGLTDGKQAHSLWMQAGAELGFPGVGFLLAFYLLIIWRLWWMAREAQVVAPDIANYCNMVIAALVGFMVAAQFVTLVGLEIPYYVAMVGAGYLKLSDQLEVAMEHRYLDDHSHAYYAAPHLTSA